MKQKPSKLDPHAERIEEWFLAGKPLLYAQAQLAQDGVHVSASRLSEWWQARQAMRQEEALLRQIATGAETCKRVEAEFGTQPPPELETLIKVHRVLILKLSTAGTVDAELLDLVNRMMKPVVAFARMQQTREQIELEQAKFREGMRRKLEAGLDAVAEAFTGNAQAMELYRQAREMIGRAE